LFLGHLGVEEEPMIYFVLEVLGTIIFALTGALKGTQKHLDIFGVVVLACCVGVGGGIVRDAIIGCTPASALVNQSFFLTSIVTGILVFYFAKYLKNHEKLINIFDAFGLGLFTFLGANKGYLYNLDIIGVILSGAITATGGGVIRDVLSGDTPPTILRTDFYATAAILGGILFYTMKVFELTFITIFLSVFLFVTAIRLFAMYFNINLPQS
jgi:uncharacterized membrane protein YeiH